jgi:hypothetical protein
VLNGVTLLEIDNSSSARNPEYDVVFVHGIGSNALDAWTTKTGEVWPTWLNQTIPNCRVLLLNYPAPIFFNKKTSTTSIRQRSLNLVDLLPIRGVGTRPTIFICHSLGGIVLKEAIRSSIEMGCATELSANTIGVAFLGTPHAGATLASLAKCAGSELLTELSLNSPHLLELRGWFSEFCKGRAICVSSYSETQTTYGVQIVSHDSADPRVEGTSCIPIDGDHFSICKPESI